ncbi:LysR family transcriptional regulator [Mangrovicoccus sp. HB161399]|uniref:LysR family transcriptional regulator n=1 Tax=Mangrovicoccus sp. HB161399 TaxID=2720392 RepID=UPI001552D2C4|nr:LysR family transcriptional regulator [Mangrovicoccus sp. HB161399]
MEFSFRQVRYFVATAEAGQVSRAALACNVSQSSITVAIAALETMLGRRLFLRQARGMRLTAEGERFLRHCHAILRSVEDATELAPAAADVSGRLRLGVTETIAGYVLPPIWRKLRRSFPGIALEVREMGHAEIDAGLRAGELDMAMLLTSNIERSPALHYEELISSPRRLWVSSRSPLAERRSLSLAELEQDYILPTMEEHSGLIGRYWQRNGFSPRILFRCHTLEAVRSMVASDLGVTILSDLVYRPWSLEGRRVVKLDLAERPPTADVGIARAIGAEPGPAGEAFLALARAETAELRDPGNIAS